jgi:hypothetical protein
MEILMNVEGTPLTATLDDSAAARDFAALLPLSLSLEVVRATLGTQGLTISAVGLEELGSARDRVNIVTTFGFVLDAAPTPEQVAGLRDGEQQMAQVDR